jgi:hypothetical protein
MKRKAYRVKDWPEYYEVSDSRKVEGPLSWVPMRTKHDGKGYRRIAAQENRSDLFSAWVLIVEVTAKLPKRWRGWLVDAKGQPLDAEDLALKTGWPKVAFESAFSYFTDVKQGWLELVELPEGVASAVVTTSGGGSETGPAAEPTPGGVRTGPEVSGCGGYTGQDIRGQDTPKAPKGAGGGQLIGPQDGGGQPTIGRQTYPEALGASPEFVACWEKKWLPYLLEKKGRMPAFATLDKQLSTCVRLGIAKAIAALESAIEKGWSAPDENARPANGSHFSSVRDWEIEPEDWKALWRETYPPEEYVDAPRYEDGLWSEVRADHKKHIHELIRKRRTARHRVA